MLKHIIIKYCKSGNIREVSVFANFASSTNSRIQESLENYYYNIATKKNVKKIREF